ncbi:AcrR family transcriptional regulator [Dietzia sp. 2505]|uniref:TetR/AcrR family transcriptional regulator n=1 Tax=Dietzia sp. 2505 TaxID=3156457 RepID=UPI00339B6EF6
MDKKSLLVAAALQVVEQQGETGFSTRAVCAIANVTAPTLYHHFGSADGLLSAAITEAFAQFLMSKKAEPFSADPVVALRQGWDNYVRFAAERPRLYAAMAVRVLQGATIPAADAGRALLVERLAAIEADGHLAMDVEAAADLIWSSAHAASTLYVLAPERQPDPTVVTTLRERAVQSICNPIESEKPT